MTSFVNLMADDVWSEVDIVAKTEAQIASEYPVNAITILNRKVTAASIGKYTLTADEQADVTKYQTLCYMAQLAGISARQDMALLGEVLPLDKARRRLRLDLVKPVVVKATTATATTPAVPEYVGNQKDIDQDNRERAAAQAVVDSASPAATVLSEKRLPTPPKPIVTTAPTTVTAP